jgi:DNA invertase Pin-like site-specific DNA recombinase
VNASEQEREFFHSLSKRRTLQLERRQKKQSRNARILDLHAKGVSVAAIAREVGCSRPTVYGVLKGCKV